MWCSFKGLFALWEIRKEAILSKYITQIDALGRRMREIINFKKSTKSPTSDNRDRSVL